MVNTSFKRSKDGRWFRELNLAGEDKPTYQRLPPKQEAELEAQYGNKYSNVNVQGNVSAVQSSQIDDLIRDRIVQHILNQEEQGRKDEASLKYQKDGGGVIRLRDNEAGNIRGDGVYEDFNSALKDLYAREGKGDKKAKQTLDQLFNIAGRKMMQITGKSVAIMACPRCGFGINTLEDYICPNCKLDLEESGWLKYGEVRG